MKLKSPLLVLAIDYHQMFKALVDRAPNLKPDVDRNIAWAKQHLGKQDRITWFLRWARAHLIQDGEKNSSGADKLPPGSTEKELKAMSAKAKKTYVEKDLWIDLPQLRQRLQHYMSLDDQGIQDKQFGYETPNDLLNELHGLEAIYKAKADEDSRLLEPQEGDEAFIKFGNGWAWWALSRGYCDEEARAMGHCGNKGMVTGDQILSLREPRKKGNQEYWEPNLTFIIDKEGYLGEMKGRGNDKPAARYHPYIVTLLKDKRVKGIKGGGYEPTHNFNMNDLSEESRVELEDAKPELMTLRRYISKTYAQNSTGDVFRRDLYHNKAITADPAVISKTEMLLHLNHETYRQQANGWVVDSWKSAQGFVEDKGNRTAQWLMDHVNGTEHLDMDSSYSDSDVMGLIDDLPGPIVNNIGLTLEYEYPDELLEFIENQGGAEEFTWEPDQDGDVKDFLEYLRHDLGIDTQVMQDLHTSYQYAAESGTSGKMWKDLKSAIEDATDDHDRLTVVWDGDFDAEIVVVVKAAEAIESAMQCEDEGGCEDEQYGMSFSDELLETLSVKASERDYNDFDYDAAKEHMKEEYGTPPKNMKTPVEGQPELFPEVYKEPAPAFGTKGVTH